MIQRPQTVYLILAFLALSATFMFNFASYSSDKAVGEIKVSINGVKTVLDSEIDGVSQEELAAKEKTLNTYVDMASNEKFGTLFMLGQVSLVIVLAIIVLVIFLYKKLSLQHRMSRLLFLMMLGVFVAAIIGASYGEGVLADNYLNVLKNTMKIDEASFTVNYSIATFMPMVAAAFVLLASIHIKKDIKLLQSIDRLR